jgi:hypothetical protein
MDIIPDHRYGEATARIQDIVNESCRIAWFRHVDVGAVQQKAEELVLTHLRTLQSLGILETPTDLGVAWIAGPVNNLCERVSDPYEPWGGRWAKWTNAISAKMTEVFVQIERSASLSSLVRPPLWPVNGKPSICGTILVAHGVNLANAGFTPSTDDWGVAWALLAQAESRIWYALVWELWQIHKPEINPYLPLLQMYELGVFPMGLEGDRFHLYHYEVQEVPSGGKAGQNN